MPLSPDCVLKNLLTSNRARLRSVWTKFSKKSISKVFADDECLQEVIDYWDHHNSRLKQYSRACITSSYSIHIIVTGVTQLSMCPMQSKWFKFIFDVVKRLHTAKNIQWLCQHKNKRLWFEFTQSMNCFLRCLPETSKLNWSKTLFDSYYRVFVDCNYFFASHWMHSCMRNMNDYFSFLTYRLSDHQLVFGKDIPSLFDHRKIPEIMWCSMLTSIVNFFVSAFNLVDDPTTDDHMKAQIATKIKTFEIIFGDQLVSFFQYVLYRVSNSLNLQDCSLLRSLLKIMEIVNVVCCLNDSNSLKQIINRCWETAKLNIHDFWCEVFQVSIENDMDESVVLFTLLSVCSQRVGKDMLTVLFHHVGEDRMSRIISGGGHKLFDDSCICKETKDALCCLIPEPVCDVVAKAVFNIISDNGVHVDDIEDIVQKWGRGGVYNKMRTFKKRRCSFLQCGSSVSMAESCCICYREDRSMFICAPCGHMFCVVCGPLSHEKCHICKTTVLSRVNKIYSNTD